MTTYDIIAWSKIYRTRIKFRGLNFRVFGWQENSWGINFRGHSNVVGTIIVGIIFVVYKFSWIKECHVIPENLYTTKFNTRTVVDTYIHTYITYSKGKLIDIANTCSYIAMYIAYAIYVSN